jgi:hypothetical protein
MPLPLYPQGEAIRYGREEKPLAFMQFIHFPSKYYSSVHLPDFLFNDLRDMKIVISRSVECTHYSIFKMFYRANMPVPEIFFNPL